VDNYRRPDVGHDGKRMSAAAAPVVAAALREEY
jgi:hypothetical protein